MFYPHPHSGNSPVVGLIRRGQFLPSRFLFGLDELDEGAHQALKTTVLIEDTIFGETVIGFIGYLFVVLFPLTGQGQQDNLAVSINHQHVFDGMLLFLATIIQPLEFFILGPHNGSFGAIVKI